MSFLLYFLLFLVVYVYFGYVVFILILSRVVHRPILKREITPTVTLMIAAYNEEKGIAQKLSESLLLDYPREQLSIVVVSDGSTDRTDEIVRSYASKGVRLIRVEGRVGKTEARNEALKQVTTEIVLFSDGTTEYQPDIIRQMVKNFADPSVGMVTAQLIYRDEKTSQMGAGQKLFWRYESMVKEAQTRLGTLTGSVGCATAFRRELYSPLPPNIIEDFTEPLTFVLKGQRVVYEPLAICYEVPTKKSSNEWKMRVRVIRGGMVGMLYARKVLNPLRFPAASFQLLSHKILRWFVPVFGILIFPVNLLAMEENPGRLDLQLLFVGQILFYSCALLSYLLERRGKRAALLSIPQYFIILNAASLLALYKTMTTPLEATWETQR